MPYKNKVRKTSVFEGKKSGELTVDSGDVSQIDGTTFMNESRNNYR